MQTTMRKIRQIVISILAVAGAVWLGGALVAEGAAKPAAPSSALATWTLSTADTKLTLGISKGQQLYIYELSSPVAGWNWTSRPSVLPLPGKVVVDGGATNSPVTWIFQNGTQDFANGKTVTLSFVCKELPTLCIRSIWWAASPTLPGPVQHTFSIVNSAGSKISVYPQLPGMDIWVQSDRSTEAWYFSKDGGDSVHPVGVLKYPLGIVSIRGPLRDGTPQHGFIPLTILNSGNAHGMYVGWECQTGSINIHGGGTSPAHVTAGYADGGDVPPDHLDIGANTNFTVPSSYLGVYNGDVDDGMNGFKRWFWNNKVPANMRNDTTEPWAQYGGMFQYATGWGANEAVFKKGMVEKLSGIPFDIVEIDYGWWGKQGAILEPDPIKWPNGMTAGDFGASGRLQFNLYFCNSVNWSTKEMLKARWATYNMNCWRDDMGRTPIPTLDWLAVNIPGYRYENCCGGAGWKDYATYRRASVATITDAVFNPLFMRMAFYDSSYVLPPAQLSQCLEWTQAPDAQLAYWLRSGMEGALFWAMATGHANVALPSDRPQAVPIMKTNLNLYKSRLPR